MLPTVLNGCNVHRIQRQKVVLWLELSAWHFMIFSQTCLCGFNEKQVAACHRNKISNGSLASDAVHGAAQTFFVQAFLKAECVGRLSDALGLVDCSDFHPGHKGIGGKL